MWNTTQYGNAFYTNDTKGFDTAQLAVDDWTKNRAPWYPYYDAFDNAIHYSRFQSATNSPLALGYKVILGGPLPDPVPLPPVTNVPGTSFSRTHPLANIQPAATQCEPGTVWNEQGKFCTDLPPNPSNPNSRDWYLAYTGHDLPGASVAGGGGGGGTTEVTVSPTIQLAINGVDTLSKAVQDALTNSSTIADATAKKVSGDIADKLNSLVTSIDTGTTTTVANLEGWSKKASDAVDTALADQKKAITDDLKAYSDFVDTAQKDVNDAVKTDLATLTTDVSNEAVNVVGPAITSIDSAVISAEKTATDIETSIKAGISDLNKLPTDLSNALGSLDATLGRSVTAANTVNKTTVQETLGGTERDTIWTRLKLMGDSLTTAFGKPSGATTFAEKTRLPELTITEAGARTFGAVWDEILSFIEGTFGYGKNTIDGIKSIFPGLVFLLGDAIELPLIAGALILAFAEAMEPLLEKLKGDIAHQAGLKKLPVGDALQAWLRGFISEENLAEDLGHNGWSPERIQVLKNLQNRLIDISTIIDMRHRGIVSDADMRDNLRDQGYITADQDALLAASYRIVDVQSAITAFRYGAITEAQLDAVLTENRFTPAEQLLVKGLLFRPEGTNAALVNDRFERLIQSGLVGGALINNVPDRVVRGATRDGQGTEEAAAAWRASIALPSIQEWIVAYFRGIVSEGQLNAIFDSYKVPPEWRNLHIVTTRSLIPFRTIPAMLAGEIITEEYAREQLAGHGFDAKAIDALIEYSGIHKRHSRFDTATTLQNIALDSLKSFWLEGTITDEQYREALLAHNFDTQTADLTIKTHAIEAHTKERKAEAQQVVDEGLAGIITDDQARTRLGQLGFTVGEISKYLAALGKKKRTTLKAPGEAELHTMLKAQIIDIDQYRLGLQQNGFSPTWVDAFVRLRTTTATA